MMMAGVQEKTRNSQYSLGGAKTHQDIYSSQQHSRPQTGGTIGKHHFLMIMCRQPLKTCELRCNFRDRQLSSSSNKELSTDARFSYLIAAPLPPRVPKKSRTRARSATTECDEKLTIAINATETSASELARHLELPKRVF